MINHENNMRLFHRDLSLRYIATVTIDTFINIIAPHPIIQKMQGIPLVLSYAPDFIMATPTIVSKLYC